MIDVTFIAPRADEDHHIYKRLPYAPRKDDYIIYNVGDIYFLASVENVTLNLCGDDVDAVRLTVRLGPSLATESANGRD